MINNLTSWMCRLIKPEKQAKEVVDAIFAAFKIVKTNETGQGGE
jgi:hypothetical protein